MSVSKFEEMLKTNGVYFFDAEEFEEIIHHYLENGDTVLAKKAMNLALQQHPMSENIKLTHAELLIFEEKYDEANVILNEMLLVSPSNDEVYIQIANLLSKKDNHLEAIQYLKKAKEFTDDLADVASLLGMEYLYLDDFANAIANFKVCIEEDPEDYASLYNVVYCFDMESKHEEAIVFLENYIEGNPYCEVAWHQLGRQYFVLKQYEKALVAFDYAIIIDDLFIGAYIEKAKTFEKLEQYENAIELYKLTLSLDDPTAFVYLRIGECYKAKGNLKKAIDFYKKAVHEDPLLDKAWALLATIHNEKQEYDKALHYINKALVLDELNIDYWKCFAELNLKLCFFEESVTAYKTCISLDENSLSHWVSLIDILSFMEQYEEALAYIQQSLIKFLNNAEIIYRHACVLYLLNSKEAAIEELRKAYLLNSTLVAQIQLIYPDIFEDEKVKSLGIGIN